MTRMLRAGVSLFLAVLFVTSSITCLAAAPKTSAASFVLMEAESGRVIASGNELQERSIASTTKIMTCLVALEHSALEEQVTVTRAHLREGSSMYLAEGETLTMEELLYGLMLPSGNDAAECIADHCGGEGGSRQFVAWMNEKAKMLGMTRTAFANPSGLDEAGHRSCALDMARLAAYAMRDPTFTRIASTRTARVGARTMTNHNKLLAKYPGCIGLKTGYTGEPLGYEVYVRSGDAAWLWNRLVELGARRLGGSHRALRLRLFRLQARMRRKALRALRGDRARRRDGHGCCKRELFLSCFGGGGTQRTRRTA